MATPTEERQWITESETYVCTLPQETQEIAERELNEDNHSRTTALDSMREWIKQNPKIKNCRMGMAVGGIPTVGAGYSISPSDGVAFLCYRLKEVIEEESNSRFLLRFLRFKKFSVVQAQECLERYILLRQTFGVAFRCLDITIPMMEELTNLGYMFACPKRDSKGRRVIVARPGVFDLEKFTQGDMCRIHAIVYESLLEDEENQVRGFVHFADGSGVGFAYLTLFTIREAVRIVKNGEKTLPMRHKEVHGFNIHPAMKFAVDWGMSLISEKIKSRVRLYSNLDDVLEQGYVEKDVLPKEYGGEMPMAEMIQLWKDELKQTHSTLMSHDQMEVHEHMYSQKQKDGAVSALKRGGVSCGSEKDQHSLCGITGNFRKLEVD